MTGFVVSDRRRRFLSFAAIALLGACLLIAAAAGAPAADVKPNMPDAVGGSAAGPPAPGLYRAGEVVVAFKEIPSGNYRTPDSPAMQAHARIGAEVKRDFTPYGLEGIQVVRIPPGLSVEKAIAIYESNPNVRFAEPNYLRELMAAPNDLYFPNQWGLLNTGQSGTTGSDIDAIPAWAITTGSSSVVVAVVDTGISYTHPDLAENIWKNIDELPGDGIDNDNNLYVDDVRGWDFAGNDNDPRETNYHGTHCAGIIGAVGNNGIGVTGVMQQAQLMPLRVFSDDGTSVDSAHIVSAWLYAADNGARIVSCSFGGGASTYSELEQEAIQGTDALFVFAAGNDATDNDLLPIYPASYPLENIIAVAATDSRDRLYYFSNYGLASVDLAAPGVGIYTTKYASSYGPDTGTSMAAPHVAGVAGLVLAKEPGISVSALKARILDGVEPIPALQGKVATGGRLNAYRALSGNPNIPAAAFTASPTSGKVPLDVAFTDQSTAATGWSWDFGDGGTSSAQSPAHSYGTAGTFTVRLTATNAAGQDVEEKTGYITVLPLVPPVASFTPTVSEGKTPLTILFTDTSTGGTPTSWSWTFGDGGTSTEQNPSHTYTTAGTYTVTLTAANGDGSDTVSVANCVRAIAPTPPVAAFTQDVTDGKVPLTVQFTDQSANAPTSWSWGFGDGGTSTEQSPSHTYTTAGTYAVTLTATNVDGTNAVTKTGLITVLPLQPPTADFRATPTSGKVSLDVTFTDLSTGATGWSWDFGDGGTSSEPSPSHTYNTAGIFTVQLTASNADGSDLETKEGYITVLPLTPPVASFTPTASEGKTPLTVHFTDTSTNVPDRWSWNFGDGTPISTEQNPSHTYLAAGTYTVTLTASNDDGSDTVSVADCVRAIAPTPPVADFTQDTTTGKVSLTVHFTDESTNIPISWSWSFGDGGTSTEQNPTHVYTTAGTFTVALTATNGDGSNTVTKTNLITVLPLQPPTADFSAVPTAGKVPLDLTFTDLSSGATTWAWEFGDGGTSTEQNPTHRYTTAGTFTVRLTATNADGSDVEAKAGYVTVSPLLPPVAAFSADVTEGTVPFAVRFNDASTNAPTSWSWSFGDGATSSDRNPVHEYTAAGAYTVRLTASNADGSDIEEKVGYLTARSALPLPVASFTQDRSSGTAPLAVQFTDTSTGGPTSWSWSFGDGTISTAQNPSHPYATSGVYTVSLTATNAGGSNTSTVEGAVTVVRTANQPVAAFAWATPAIAGSPVQFTDQSMPAPGGTISSWAWTIGGTSYTVQNPSHTFAAPGDHAATLRVKQGKVWSLVLQKTVHVQAGGTPPPIPLTASFSAAPTSGKAPLTVRFTDTSTGGVTAWQWDFNGDGVIDSVLQNPSYRYTGSGTYSVGLTVSDASGKTATATRTNYITVTARK